MLTEEKIIELTVVELLKSEEDEREAEAMDFRAIVTRNEAKYKKDLQAMFRLQEAEVLGKLESLKHILITASKNYNHLGINDNKVKDISDLFMFDVILWESNLQQFSYDHMLKSCNENGIRVYDDLQDMGKQYKQAINKTFDMDYPEAILYLEEQSIKLAGSVTAVTEKAVSDIIITGLAEGWTVNKVADKIGELFDRALDVRAAQIARTEIARAANYGAISAYAQSGVVTGKEWLTAQDEQVCQFCRSMNREVKGLNEEFLDLHESLEGDEGGVVVNDYLAVSAPPLHVSCRCTVLPVMKTIQF